MEKEKVCKVPNYNGKIKTLGYCVKYYQQQKRYGRLTPELERGDVKIYVRYLDVVI